MAQSHEQGIRGAQRRLLLPGVGILSGGSQYINVEVPYGDHDDDVLVFFNYQEYNGDNDATKDAKGVDEDSKKVLDFLNTIYQGVDASSAEKNVKDKLLNQLEAAATAMIQPNDKYFYLSKAGEQTAEQLKTTILKSLPNIQLAELSLQQRAQVIARASGLLKKIVNDADLIDTDADTDTNTEEAGDLFAEIILDAYNAAGDDATFGGAAGAAAKTDGGADNDMTDGGAETAAASAATTEAMHFDGFSWQVTLMILFFLGSWERARGDCCIRSMISLLDPLTVCISGKYDFYNSILK